MAEALAELQRRVIGALHHAGGAVDGAVAPSPTMSATQCLDVYRRGYRLRLLGCLREVHPGLLHLAGGELFDAFALDYLDAHPPAGYSLARLGDGFADHLEATCPDDERGPWAELLVDVVRFERAFLDTYDGPGTEGQPTVWSTGASAIGVTAAPGVRVVRSRFPVGEYVCAVRRGEKPPMPAARPTHEVLVRRNYVVDRVPLTAGSCAALEALMAGAGPAQAARAGCATESEVLGWITDWAERGLFTQISVPGREASCS